MMPPNTTPGPPPVITNEPPPQPPVPQQNPWVLQPAAPETGALHIEYFSTRAMGIRGELAAGRYNPMSYVISVFIWAFLVGGFVIPYANGQVAVGIALSLFGSLLLNVVLGAILFLVRYPNAATMRRLSYTLLRTGLHGRNPQGTTFKSWKELRSVKRVGDDLIFDYGVMVTAYMPVEAFRDEASAERFIQAIRALKAANGDFAAISPELYAEFAALLPATA